MADTLDTLPAGRWAAIRAVTHSQRQRLLELGFIPGTIVRAVQISPLGCLLYTSPSPRDA